jgi:undecaprenyl-phosphate 4-deoxy-4-formamido-L-arabinose transferase
MGKEKILTVSIVIPVYGSEKILPSLTDQIIIAMDSSRYQYEVILVCDASPDKSWDVISQLCADHSHIKGILLRVNAGQHNALMAGFREASGSIIVTMDDDLQHSPSNIMSLIEAILDGNDAAYGKFISRNHPIWKRVGSKINGTFSSYLLGKDPSLYLSPFRAFSKDISVEIQRYEGPYVYIDGLILGCTRKVVEVDVPHYERFSGKSSYGLRKSISLWLKMATSFSVTPLRLTSFVGLFFSALGFFMAFLLIIQKFTLNAMPVGWSSIVVTILIIGGIQMMAIGVIGEYLGRALLTINRRPQYVISDQVGFVSKSLK